MPAAVLYRRAPDDPEYRLLNIAVLHIVDGKIAELTGFDATDKLWLGLPRRCDHKVPLVDESGARGWRHRNHRPMTRPAEPNATTRTPSPEDFVTIDDAVVLISSESVNTTLGTRRRGREKVASKARVTVSTSGRIST
jgi:hypothetical protein